MKNINIHNKANIDAEGKLNSGNCKPVVCVDNGKVFTSLTDAAEYVGVSLQTMSVHMRGKTRTCAGKHFCYLSSVMENLNTITTRLRETSSYEEDAKRWREQQEREKKRQEKIAKVEAKIAVLQEEQDKCLKKWQDARNRLAAALDELNELNGD